MTRVALLGAPVAQVWPLVLCIEHELAATLRSAWCDPDHMAYSAALYQWSKMPGTKCHQGMEWSCPFFPLLCGYSQIMTSLCGGSGLGP